MIRPGTTLENTLLGSFAAAGACCVMIPVDTVKTRIVMQNPGDSRHYTGMIDCFNQVVDNIMSLFPEIYPHKYVFSLLLDYS